MSLLVQVVVGDDFALLPGLLVLEFFPVAGFVIGCWWYFIGVLRRM
jgi:hypothetical protein